MTLHRRIVQALTPNTPSNLYQICRSAARERFTSAVDFVQSLRPQHLQSFWYFASAQHFALIGTFGCLLLGSSHGDDAEFYRGKLREYRWMLKLNSQNGAKFMKPAIGILDDNLMFVNSSSSRTEAAAVETPSEGVVNTPDVSNVGFVEAMQPHLHDLQGIVSPAGMSVYPFENFQQDLQATSSPRGPFQAGMPRGYAQPMNYGLDATNSWT